MEIKSDRCKIIKTILHLSFLISNMMFLILLFAIKLLAQRSMIIDCLIKFVIRLNILQVKKVVLQIVLIIILERSELIHRIHCLLNNIDCSEYYNTHSVSF